MNDEQFERLVQAVQFAIDDRTEAPSIEQRPHWFQNTWATGPVVGSVQVEGVGEMKEVCASGCCLAGNVVLTAGGKFVSTPAEVLRWSQQQRPGVKGIEVPWLNQAVMPDGRMNEISDEAEALLGINRAVDCSAIGWDCEVPSFEEIDDHDVSRHDLFSGDNGIEDILHIASIAAKEYGYDLRSRLVGLDDLNLDEEVSW